MNFCEAWRAVIGFNGCSKSKCPTFTSSTSIGVWLEQLLCIKEGFNHITCVLSGSVWHGHTDAKLVELFGATSILLSRLCNWQVIGNQWVAGTQKPPCNWKPFSSRNNSESGMSKGNTVSQHRATCCRDKKMVWALQVLSAVCLFSGPAEISRAPPRPRDWNSAGRGVAVFRWFLLLNFVSPGEFREKRAVTFYIHCDSQPGHGMGFDEMKSIKGLSQYTRIFISKQIVAVAWNMKESSLVRSSAGRLVWETALVLRGLNKQLRTNRSGTSGIVICCDCTATHSENTITKQIQAGSRYQPVQPHGQKKTIWFSHRSSQLAATNKSQMGNGVVAERCNHRFWLGEGQGWWGLQPIAAVCAASLAAWYARGGIVRETGLCEKLTCYIICCSCAELLRSAALAVV